jgi:atypical dual specificity phosphatase
MSIIVRFSVVTFIDQNATVSVLGTVPELGCWNEENRVELKRNPIDFRLEPGLEPSFWYEDIKISFKDKQNLNLEYKFARQQNGNVLEWEGEGPSHNRKQTLHLDDQTSSELLVNGIYYLPVGIWIEKTGQENEFQHTTRFFSNVQREQILHTSKIMDNIWLGSCPQKRLHVLELKALGISAVINLQSLEDVQRLCSGFYGSLEDIPRALKLVYKEEGLAYIWIPVQDLSSEARVEMLPQVVYLLHGLLKGGHKVYVHCNGGVGRSVAAVAGYMMYVLKWSPAKIACHVCSRRPVSYIDGRALSIAEKDFKLKFSNAL